jgi:hypothetical protein
MDRNQYTDEGDPAFILADRMAKRVREEAEKQGVKIGPAEKGSVYHFQLADGSVSLFWLVAAKEAIASIERGEILIKADA